MHDTSTASSFDNIVLLVLKQGRNKWPMVANYHTLNTVVISIETPEPNIIKTTKSIQSVASKCLTIIYWTSMF